MSHKFFRRDSKTEKSVSKTTNNNNNDDVRKDFTDRKAQLSSLEYRVTQERQTERPFSNKYNKHWEPGTYHCKVCHAELFASTTKFESKSGWPAFYNVVDTKRVKLTADLSHIGANLLLLIKKPDLARTEVSCAVCNAHLGHLFKDGPKPTGLRYCINSASLTFVPADTSLKIDMLQQSVAVPAPEEFPCNPYNSCSYEPSSQPNFNPESKAKSQTLPPIASLCLRGSGTTTEQRKNQQNPERNNFKPSDHSRSTDLIDVLAKPKPSFQPETTFLAKNGEQDKNNSGSNTTNSNGEFKKQDENFTRTSSSRYPSSRGASLTAARIMFFQSLSNPSTEANNPPPYYKASQTFNQNRFVNSASSGSLGLKSTQDSRNGKDFHRSSNDSTPKEGSPFVSKSIETISSAPVPLKETCL